MFTEGNIITLIHFFKNGATAKHKYFLVLKNVGDHTILASLPSSVVHLPGFADKIHGCIDMPDSCISCYVFQQKIPVTKCGWYFDLDTFLYGNWLDDYDVRALQETYRIEGIEYEIIGQLTDAELENVRKCFRNSSVVKRRYKKLLA